MTKNSKIVYQTDFTDFLSMTESPENQILVAESWLVRNGCAIALDLHRQRFLNSCSHLYQIGSRMLTPYWQAALEKIPSDGLWFPRIELAGYTRQPKFQVRVRKAPPLKETIKLCICDVPDKRKAPRHKGPDISLLGKLRTQILEQGADEGIIVSPKGYLLEGLTTSILWWQEINGKETLCAVPDANRILPGTTRKLILSIAKQKGIPIAYRLVLPDQLNGCEVWAVNALHGIRPAIPWQGSPFTPKNDDRAVERLKKWQQSINALFRKELSVKV
ncbi:MAG: aminotransferase class IV [Oxalobacter sp.]|nr:aminotransferase class IV [Oxalobacter sp.]